MAILRSPILIFGILVVLLAAGLGVAPFFINWNAYRSVIEDYAGDVTGRPVKITGDVSARLFPWPSLRLQGIRVGNAPGAQDADFISAGAVQASFLLGSLLGGHFEVSSIRIEDPVLALERMPGGHVNWMLAPKGDVLSRALPANVSFDSISITGGTILLRDAERGGVARLTDFTAQVTSPSLQGPWKLKGSADAGGEQRLGILFTTGRITADDPVKIGLRLSPEGGPGLVYAADGDASAAGFDGTLSITPYVEESGKSNSESTVRQLGFKADTVLRADKVTLSKIEIAPIAGDQATNVLGGEAEIRLGKTIGISAKLAAARFDLDGILGSSGKALLRSGQALDVAAAVIGELPDGVTGKLSADLGALKAGGDTLERVKLSAALGPSGIKISELSAAMPGQAEARFAGDLVTAGGAARLAGDLTLSARSLRDLLSWLVPEWQPSISAGWTGARGQLALTSRFDMTPSGLDLGNMAYTLDDAKGEGSLSLKGGETPAVALRSVIDRLDLDRYFPDGVGGFPSAGFSALSAAHGRAELTLQADHLRLRGVDAAGLMLAASADPQGITLDSLRISDVGSARLEAQGAFQPFGSKPAGKGSVTLSAQDPRGFLRLAGLIPAAAPGQEDPAWSRALGPLKLSLSGEGHTPAAQTLMTVNGTATAGASAVDLSATFAGVPVDWMRGTVALTARVQSPSSSELAQLFGLPAAAPPPGAAALRIEARGSVQDGFAAKADLRGFGGSGSFEGRAAALPFTLDGKFTLGSQSANAVLAAAGLPTPAAPVALSLAGQIKSSGGAMALSGISGDLIGEPVTGSLSLGSGRIGGELTAGRLPLPWLLGTLLLRQDAAEVTGTTLFAKPPLGGIAGTLVIRSPKTEPLAGFAFPAEISIKSDPAEGLKLAVKGEPFTLDLAAAQREGDIAITGDISARLPLASVLADGSGGVPLSGTGIITAHLEGRGRSPAGFIIGAGGRGTLSVADLVIAHADPAPVASVAAQGGAPGDRIAAALAGAGDFAVTAAGEPAALSISNGVVTSAPLAISGPGGKGSLKLTADLNNGSVDLAAAFTLPDASVPGYEIAWSGAPRALERSVDIGALKASLQSRALQQDMKKLEDLQREQQRLAAEEEERLRQAEEMRQKKAAADEAAAAKAAEDAQNLEAAAAARVAAEKAKRAGQKTPQPVTPPQPVIPPLLPDRNPDSVEVTPLVP